MQHRSFGQVPNLDFARSCFGRCAPAACSERAQSSGEGAGCGIGRRFGWKVD